MKIETHNLVFLGEITYPDIVIPSEKVTFICGESGCGKSSLLKLINKTANASEGAVLYKGNESEPSDAIELRKKVMLVSQNVFLFDGSIKENFLQFYKFREEPIINEKEMIKNLSICQLEFPLDTLCERMSGGERQRVFLAICLSLHPDTLMLDEPTSALDEATAGKVMESIVGFVKKNKMTLVVVSHASALSEKWADQIISLERGKANE